MHSRNKSKNYPQSTGDGEGENSRPADGPTVCHWSRTNYEMLFPDARREQECARYNGARKLGGGGREEEEAAAQRQTAPQGQVPWLY